MSIRFKILFHFPGKGDIPFTTFANIYLGDHGVVKGHHLVTPRFTESEIDSQIDDLMSQLEEVRKEAKSKFKEAQLFNE